MFLKDLQQVVKKPHPQQVQDLQAGHQMCLVLKPEAKGFAVGDLSNAFSLVHHIQIVVFGLLSCLRGKVRCSCMWMISSKDEESSFNSTVGTSGENRK